MDSPPEDKEGVQKNVQGLSSETYNFGVEVFLNRITRLCRRIT